MVLSLPCIKLLNGFPWLCGQRPQSLPDRGPSPPASGFKPHSSGSCMHQTPLPASGPLHMPCFQAGISSLPPSTPKYSPVFQVPFLGKSGQGPPNPCPFGSRDFCSQDVWQFVVGIYDFQLFVCSVSSNGPWSPPSTLLTVWGTETLNIERETLLNKWRNINWLPFWYQPGSIWGSKDTRGSESIPC